MLKLNMVIGVTDLRYMQQVVMSLITIKSPDLF